MTLVGWARWVREARTQGAGVAALLPRPRTQHRPAQRGQTAQRSFRFELLFRDERMREIASVERAQVVETLAHAEQLHGQAELLRDRDRDAAFRRAVELRQ